jgi:uncharacterized membrane-anchored protein YjiN (DUF445 family)
MSVEIKSYCDPNSDRITLGVTFEQQFSEQALNAIVTEIVQRTAERYVAENYPQLVAKIDQQAIANLVIAESGKKIAEEIRLTPPVPRIETKREVYQRGIFGGVRRVL